jgi:hypothetical protein
MYVCDPPDQRGKAGPVDDVVIDEYLQVGER